MADLIQLDQLEDPGRVGNEALGVQFGLDGAFQLRVIGLVDVGGREEVGDERQEQRLVLVDQLGQVHVAQHAVDDGRLRVAAVGAFGRAQRPQHRQDVTQAKVVVHLLQRSNIVIRRMYIKSETTWNSYSIPLMPKS